MLTHGNILANLSQAHAWIKAELKEGEELVVTALPLYHIFALTANCFLFMRIGARNLLITNPRDLKSLCLIWPSILYGHSGRQFLVQFVA